MTRWYARAPRGERAYAHAPGPHTGNITLVFGLRADGVVAPMLVPGAMTKVRFEAYVRDNLATGLGPGDVVVLDNLAAHKTAAVATRIGARGARVGLLPGYSPDFTPVENCGSKVKTALRAAATRTWDALVDATATALHAVTPQDAAGWFGHAAAAHQAGIRAARPHTRRRTRAPP
jgi:transposase